MAYQAGKLATKRTKPSYVYSIISISLVLFMLGLLGLIIVQADKLSDYFKENIEISIILKDNIKEAEIYQLQKQLEAENYVKSTEYVSKDEAARRLIEENKEDFIELLEYNPLYASINMNLNADYAYPDSLEWIEESILKKSQVKEIYYYRKLVDLISKNVRKIGLLIMGISILLFLIALTLIDNTIRLAMYSNRFLIKSMQLVGATRWFVMKPFLSKSIINGIISAGFAILALTSTLYYGIKNVPELELLQDTTKFTILLVALLAVGIIISWLSTRRAVRKYLKMKLEDLY